MQLLDSSMKVDLNTGTTYLIRDIMHGLNIKYAEEWCKKAVKLQPTCTAVATTASNTASTSVAPQCQDPTKALNTTPAARTTQQDYVSKYLVQYVAKDRQEGNYKC